MDLSPEPRAVHLRFISEIATEKLIFLPSDVRANLRAIATALETELDQEQRQEEIQRFLSKRLKRYLVRSFASFDPNGPSADLDLTNELPKNRRVLNLETVLDAGRSTSFTVTIHVPHPADSHIRFLRVYAVSKGRVSFAGREFFLSEPLPR